MSRSRLRAALLIVAAVVLTVSVVGSVRLAQVAHTARPLPQAVHSSTCTWHLTPKTTWSHLSIEHHFHLVLTRQPDMTALVRNGQAHIYYRDEWTGAWELLSVSRSGVNTWGVPTRWVVPVHVATGFFDSTRWIIQWPNGANGIICESPS